MKKALSLLLAATLAACAPATPAASQASTPPPVASAASEAPAESAPAAKEFANKELSIAIFQGGYGPDYWNDMIAKFEAAYPGVKVTMNINPRIAEIIRPQIIAGNAPDFLAIDDTDQSGLITSMIKERLLMDITDVFDGKSLESDKTVREIVVPGMLDSSHFQPYNDGKIFLAPFNYGPQGFMFNKTLFDAKGWKLPTTWDEFFALGDELKKEENFLTNADGSKTKRALFTYQGIYASYLEGILYPSIASFAGRDAMSKIGQYAEGSFATPEVLKVLETIQKISKGYLMDGTVALNHTQSQADMMMGKALFITNGVWMENEMKDSPREDGFEFGHDGTSCNKHRRRALCYHQLPAVLHSCQSKEPRAYKGIPSLPVHQGFH